MKSLVTYQTGEYGQIAVTLSKVMKCRNMTRNRLATLMGVKYAVVDRYYKGKQIALVDLDFLAKVCYVLDCRVEDLLEYQKPEKTGGA
ncbi:MAG: helix-turn-helix transcriptional regulator [Oscillibacter sp.]|nr:helix-turn-helix transcriptional regulator [Oscillibacter sp.]